MHDTLRRALCLAVIGVHLAGCSVTSPVLQPPAGRGARDVSRDMAECEAASTPGIGTYAKAAGQGLLARIATPFVGIAAALTGGRAAAAPGAAEAGSMITPGQQGDQRGAVMAIAGIGAVVGIVAGPFVGYHFASETIRDARQDRFERCLVARGYAPPPAPRAPRVLVLVATDMTRPSAVQAFRGELERRGYAFGKTLDVELQWWDGPQAADRSVLAQGWDIIVAGSGEIAVAVQPTLPQTPIILAASELDPVATGLARSHERPRRNVSGLTLAAAELNAPRVELLLRAVPHVTRLAVLANPDNADHVLSASAVAGRRATSTCGASTCEPTAISTRSFAGSCATASTRCSCSRSPCFAAAAMRSLPSPGARGCRRSRARSASPTPVACSSTTRGSTRAGERRRPSSIRC